MNNKGELKRTLFRLTVVFLTFYFVLFVFLVPENNFRDGMEWMDRKDRGYRDAVSSFQRAVIGTKYFHFYNKKQLPKYYYWLGRARMSLCEYKEAENALLSAYSLLEERGERKAQGEQREKREQGEKGEQREQQELRALTELNLGMVSTELDKNREAVSYATEALEYFSKHTEKNGIELRNSYLFLSGAYVNLKEYDKVADLMEKLIPIFYENITWGIEDRFSVKLMATIYKLAEVSYTEIGNTKKSEEYRKKLEDFAWLHEVSSEDIKESLDSFSWHIDEKYLSE